VLDFDQQRALRGNHRQSRQKDIDQHFTLGSALFKRRIARPGVFFNNRLVGKTEPAFDGRQSHIQQPDMGRRKFGIEIRVLCQVKLVDHLAGNVAGLNHRGLGFVGVVIRRQAFCDIFNIDHIAAVTLDQYRHMGGIERS